MIKNAKPNNCVVGNYAIGFHEIQHSDINIAQLQGQHCIKSLLFKGKV